MPFKSKAQERWMFATHPEMAKKWAADTPSQSDLPDRAGDSVKPSTKGKRSDPKMAGLQELHSMLSGAIADKLKAKKSAKLDRSKAKADADDTELGASGEAADETDPRVQRRKVQFGRGGK